MRESRTPGSVRGVLSNEHPYRDSVPRRNPSTVVQPDALYSVAGPLQSVTDKCWRNLSQWEKKRAGEGARE